MMGNNEIQSLVIANSLEIRQKIKSDLDYHLSRVVESLYDNNHTRYYDKSDPTLTERKTFDWLISETIRDEVLEQMKERFYDEWYEAIAIIIVSPIHSLDLNDDTFYDCVHKLKPWFMECYKRMESSVKTRDCEYISLCAITCSHELKLKRKNDG